MSKPPKYEFKSEAELIKKLQNIENQKYYSLHTYHSRNLKFNKELSMYSNHFEQRIMTNSTSASLLKVILSKFSHKDHTIFMLLIQNYPLKNF